MSRYNFVICITVFLRGITQQNLFSFRGSLSFFIPEIQILHFDGAYAFSTFLLASIVDSLTS